ncbi:MAG TPA: glycogen debranching N-terminal domain-containing protein, partial [Bdellovibrionales bacterium]|nr:glycogen debranching N-terminal domain-containing protein [Bdellovibrionales bacterium]
MSHIIEVDNKFYILATSSLAEARTRVIKQDESFAVFDRLGDIHPFNKFGQGIFFGGTRFLSQLELTIGNHKPILLSSNLREDNGMLVVDLTNADFYDLRENFVTKGQVHVRRQIFLWQDVCYQKLTIENFGNSPIELPMSLIVEADYIDIFEVRGMIRNKRGEKLAPKAGAGTLELTYRGLDGIFRRTHIATHGLSPEIEGSAFRFNLSLPPKASKTFYVTFSLLLGNARPSHKSFEDAERELIESNAGHKHAYCEITSSHAQFNRWVKGSLNDLIMMTTETYAGPYPYAGIPWYSSAFGRDGIITALECLWANPGMARGVLSFLASTQSHTLSEERDAEAGKILHEARYGEMANLKEIPFGQYYGSVDSTPLFIVLAGAYFDRTNDIEFIRSIWPNIREAIQWLDQFGDFDHDGFVEYQKHSADGLIQQGWKDSHDSVFHANGAIAIPPIALCEVQGYVFDAKLQGSKLAALLGEIPLSARLKEQALDLQKKFETHFWCEELGMYAQ